MSAKKEIFFLYGKGKKGEDFYLIEKKASSVLLFVSQTSHQSVIKTPQIKFWD